MTENDFWGLIGMVTPYDLRDDLGAGADPEELADLQRALKALPDAEALGFYVHFATKIHALDTPTHHKHCRVGWIWPKTSADAFLYARCHVVSLGAAIYDDVLSDPIRFPRNLWFDAVLYLANETYDRVADARPASLSIPNYESFTNPLWSRS